METLSRIRKAKVVGVQASRFNWILNADVSPEDYVVAWSRYIFIVKEARALSNQESPLVRSLQPNYQPA